MAATPFFCPLSLLASFSSTYSLLCSTSRPRACGQRLVERDESAIFSMVFSQHITDECRGFWSAQRCLPGLEEADHSAATERVRPRRRGHAGSVEHLLTERSRERTLASRARRRVARISAGEFAGRACGGWYGVVFGLTGLAVLIGLFPVVGFVGVGVFLPLTSVGRFSILRPTAVLPGVRVPLLPRRLQSLVFYNFPAFLEYVMKLFKVTVVSSTNRAVSGGPERGRASRETPSQKTKWCAVAFPPSKPRVGQPSQEVVRSSPDITEAVRGTQESLRKGRF